MKKLILIYLFGALSVSIGCVVWGYLVWKQRSIRAIATTVIVFFGAPFLLYGIVRLKEEIDDWNYKRDVEFVTELCAKYGGDQVYRTADNVEGVFQMQAMPFSDSLRGNQFGLLQPWAVIYGDGPDSAIQIGTNNGSYWFIEQQPPHGQPNGPPYRRTVLVDSGFKIRDKLPYAKNLDDTWWSTKQLNVQTLRSRYGYLVEDIGTKELRRRWIAAGRVKIIDLQTNEVIAERVGYVRATGHQVLLAWSLGKGCVYPANAQTGPGVFGFVRSVLRPPVQWPTQTQLELIQEN